jgi:hypothetical protein
MLSSHHENLFTCTLKRYNKRYERKINNIGNAKDQ